MNILSIEETVNQILEVQEDKAKMKNINIETIYLDFPIHKGKQILHVRTDHKRLQQVLLNLLSNALKFTEKNGRILVMVMLMRGKKESLRISVVDSGVGIKTED